MPGHGGTRPIAGPRRTPHSCPKTVRGSLLHSLSCACQGPACPVSGHDNGPPRTSGEANGAGQDQRNSMAGKRMFRAEDGAVYATTVAPARGVLHHAAVRVLTLDILGRLDGGDLAVAIASRLAVYRYLELRTRRFVRFMPALSQPSPHGATRRCSIGVGAWRGAKNGL